MAQPVWVLSVDLQTKTATFQSGMADAAKSATGAFKDIRQGAGDMGRDVGYSMTEARHGVMILGEEFGVHLPRALTSFIAGLGPIGAAMEAAFPFLAIVLGATLLIEHLAKVKEEGDKLARSQDQFLTATNNAFNALDEKILQAEIRSDELNKDHFAALHHQLELINKQSMSELMHSFDVIAKGADVAFGNLKVGWYSSGIGSAGAKHALEDFKAQYDSLLAQSKDKEAADLLAGTRQSAEHILTMQKEFIGNQVNANTGKGGDGRANPEYNKFVEAHNALIAAGVGATEKEVQAQEKLVAALNAQLQVETRVKELKDLQGSNAQHTTNNAVTADAYKALKAQMDAERAEQEQIDKEHEEARARAITNIQQGEREKIEATEKGSAQRLAAIDAAIKEENNKGLQETAFYRTLLSQRIEVLKEKTAEENRIRTEAGHEAAEHEQKMDELKLAADEEHSRLELSRRRVTEQELTANAIAAESRDYEIKKTGLDRQIAALDKGGKDYQNKLTALQDKETELTQQHENKITQILKTKPITG